MHKSFVVIALGLVSCGPDSFAVGTEAFDEGVELDRAELTSAAMLAFLNGPDATVELLDGDVGLDARAAKAIVAHVRGPDGTLGTGDDNLLQSISELDAIAYVGDSSLVAIDRYATARYGAEDIVVEGVRFTHAEAALIVAVCNDSRLDQTPVSNLVKLKLSEARPHQSLATVAATYSVGKSALTGLRDFAARLLGPTTVTPPASTTCSEVEGKRDGVFFTAAQACQAVAFLNTARTSDMWRLPRTALDFIYYGAPNRPLGEGKRSRWLRLNEYSDSVGVGKGAVQALLGSLETWKSGGPTTDTIADAWARRTELVDRPVRFERVFVTKTFGLAVDPYRSWIGYDCGELRDSPSATTYVKACFTRVAADSAGGCQRNDCYADTLNTWVNARGEWARSTTQGSGGYVVWLTNTGFAAP